MQFELVDYYQNVLGRTEIPREHFYLSNELARWSNSRPVTVRIERSGTVHCCRLMHDLGRRHRLSFNDKVKHVHVGHIVQFDPGTINVDMKVWADASKRGTMGHGEAVRTET